MQPCRILLSHFVGGSGSVTGFSSGFDYASVQAHRLQERFRTSAYIRQLDKVYYVRRFLGTPA